MTNFRESQGISDASATLAVVLTHRKLPRIGRLSDGHHNIKFSFLFKEAQASLQTP
jgi:hypothetical protein